MTTSTPAVPVPSSTPLLSAEGLQVGYGDLVAVWDASIEVQSGRIVSLVGRNGAGKTTFLLGIAGLLNPAKGSVTLEGDDITKMPPYRRSSRGLSLVLEGKRVFRDLTVRENLVLAAPTRRQDRRDLNERIDEMYERFPALKHRQQKPAGDLSGGQQQMLAIAQSLMCRPRVLMLDEPSSGLAPVVVDEVFDLLTELKQEGLGIILVEQLVAEMLGGIADDIVVLDGGRVALSGPASSMSIEQLAGLVYAR